MKERRWVPEDGEVCQDEFDRYARVTGYRGGYIVAERIDRYGERNGPMAMYLLSELRPATLAKRRAKAKNK